MTQQEKETLTESTSEVIRKKQRAKAIQQWKDNHIVIIGLEGSPSAKQQLNAFIDNPTPDELWD